MLSSRFPSHIYCARFILPLPPVPVRLCYEARSSHILTCGKMLAVVVVMIYVKCEQLEKCLKKKKKKGQNQQAVGVCLSWCRWPADGWCLAFISRDTFLTAPGVQGHGCTHIVMRESVRTHARQHSRAHTHTNPAPTCSFISNIRAAFGRNATCFKSWRATCF